VRLIKLTQTHSWRAKYTHLTNKRIPAKQNVAVSNMPDNDGQHWLGMFQAGDDEHLPLLVVDVSLNDETVSSDIPEEYRTGFRILI